jgi:hypothetical protein
MELNKILQNVLVMGTSASIIIACSSDDAAPPPPPTVDCNATGPSVSLTANSTICGQDDGEIALAIVGGTGNLTVNIDPQSLGLEFANNTFTSLEPGTYTIEVIDTDNCSSTATATVSFSVGNVSYQNDIDPIVQARCAIAGCHDGSNSAIPNYNIFAEFQARAHNDPLGIRQRVKTDDMPRQSGNDTQPGDPLSAEEKVALFCWIDEGALDN